MYTMLCIGGMKSRDQLERCSQGVHIMVGTPGRLSDMVEKNKL